jgi:hypothetical protein
MHGIMTPYQQAEAEKGYQQEWEASADIQAEVGGNYDVYRAFRNAQDNGLLPSDQRPRRRLTLAQVLEHVTLTWQTDHERRQRHASLEAYRPKRVFEHVLGTTERG